MSCQKNTSEITGVYEWFKDNIKQPGGDQTLDIGQKSEASGQYSCLVVTALSVNAKSEKAEAIAIQYKCTYYVVMKILSSIIIIIVTKYLLRTGIALNIINEFYYGKIFHRFENLY